MPEDVNQPGELLPGELFEDCRHHPCLCIEANSPDDVDGVSGISLVDGTPCGCSIMHCGLRKLTLEEAVHWKYHGPKDVVGGSVGHKKASNLSRRTGRSGCFSALEPFTIMARDDKTLVNEITYP